MPVRGGMWASLLPCWSSFGLTDRGPLARPPDLGLVRVRFVAGLAASGRGLRAARSIIPTHPYQLRSGTLELQVRAEHN